MSQNEFLLARNGIEHSRELLSEELIISARLHVAHPSPPGGNLLTRIYRKARIYVNKRLTLLGKKKECGVSNLNFMEVY